ncbi:hypothetical protein [Campylobacter curvus]|uniref:Uncharacterized protein n=1 Tax=Campylobacter curvus (strain 525.92) TaxID=360105 RepID=A7H0V0_CAMC5|nr:hypothetical protein [Campylobacter curvus]EAU00343.2 hypothetical protein CCV52592_0039 [Campylobacter curvus 525.92]
MNINLNIEPLEVFYKVLDKHWIGWEKRKDDYYLTELAYLIKIGCESSLTDETIINSLRKSNVEKYQLELNVIYHFSTIAIRLILDNRMSASRQKATQARYLGTKTKPKHRVAKKAAPKERNLFEGIL